MLEKIAEIVGVTFNEDDAVTLRQLNMIRVQLAEGTSVDDPDFAEKVKNAEKLAAEKLNSMFGAMANSAVAVADANPSNVLPKAKLGTPKGTRIAIEGFAKFSFGPVWNASVIAGTGIALAEIPQHREKLAAQAVYLGVYQNADEARAAVAASAKEVAAQLAQKRAAEAPTVTDVPVQTVTITDAPTEDVSQSVVAEEGEAQKADQSEATSDAQ